MQYVLSDAEYAYVEELKKTLCSWEIIFERFKLQFKDCPLKTQAKLQRCYGYLKNKLKKEPGVASSPIGEPRKRKKTSTALPANESVGASSPDETIANYRQMVVALIAESDKYRQMVVALIAESDTLVVRLEEQTELRKHFETEQIYEFV